MDFKFYFNQFMRRLPLFVIVATLVSVIGIAVAMLLPARYSASTTILVEGPKISEQLANSSVTASPVEQLNVIRQRLMTRGNLIDVARRLKVFPGINEMTGTQIAQGMQGSTSFNLVQLGDSGSRDGARTIAFSINFSSENRSKAADVANEYASLILQEGARLRSDMATGTLDFFEQEVSRLAGELSRIESEMLAFQTQNQESLPNSLDYRRNQQVVLQERLLQLERTKAELQTRRRQQAGQISANSGIGTVGASASPQEMELIQLQQDLVEKRAIYSEQHPQIRALRSRINALQSIVRPVNRDGERVASSAEAELALLDEQIEMVETQTTDIESELSELQVSIDQTPDVEVRLNNLTRTYENTQLQYNQARQKLAAAAQGERIELRREGESFEVIERATVPDEPVSPNRKAIAAASVAAGIGLGIMLVALLEFLDKTVRRSVELSTRLNIEPLATIPYIQSHGEVRRRNLGMIAIVAAIVISVPLMLWAIHYYYLPLDLIFDRLLAKFGL
ncbi:GumC family protein [Paracoccaceae bacterium GXU_MW_L88]